MWDAYRKKQLHENAKERLAEKLLIAEFQTSKGITGKAMYIEPTLYLEVYIDLGKDEYHNEGYVFKVDDTFKIISGKYIYSLGKGKYSDVQLQQNDLTILENYYKLKELDLLDEFHKKIIS